MTKSQETETYTAFAEHNRIATGTLLDVALTVRQEMKRDKSATVLVFNNSDSKTVELDLRGTLEEIRKRFAGMAPKISLIDEDEDLEGAEEKKTGPGRPKLGVVSREISLLPRHWEWLSTQRGGASVTLRKLVEEAKKTSREQDRVRKAQESTYRFMNTMAGNMPHFEEALRALYAGDEKKFKLRIAQWPQDIREHTEQLAKDALELK